jgi:hypothetical protein
MSNRNDTDARTIHPNAIRILGEEACIVALGVARDLRSGDIPPERYDQGTLCGTACCIAGHIAYRMNRPQVDLWARVICTSIPMVSGKGLFAGGNPSNPILAANAIERFLFEGSERPWAS